MAMAKNTGINIQKVSERLHTAKYVFTAVHIQ